MARFDRTDPANLALLQNPQQTCLCIQWQLTDLIEKQSSAVSGFYQPGTGRAGASEGSLFVAEQLRLDQGFGNRRSIDTNKWCLAALALFMNGSRHQLLAGSRLALDQHRDVSRCRFANARINRLHGWTVTDHLLPHAA